MFYEEIINTYISLGTMRENRDRECSLYVPTSISTVRVPREDERDG
jgi:hypothetical protein